MMPGNSLPLLRRTPCWPGESLPSLLERLTQLNHYAGVRILGRLYRTPQEPVRSLLVCPRDGVTFLRLAHLTQLPAAELLAASNHRFTPILTLSGSPPLLSWLDAPRPGQGAGRPWPQRGLRPPAAAQYCPVCLQTAPYHRLSWIPIAATLCLAHRCLLVDRCCQCHRPVAIAAIVRRRCPTCQTDLRAAGVMLVVGDDWGILAQQLIQSWFAVADPPTLPTGCRLPPQSPALLSRLVEVSGATVIDLPRDLANSARATRGPGETRDFFRPPTALSGASVGLLPISRRMYRRVGLAAGVVPLPGCLWHGGRA